MSEFVPGVGAVDVVNGKVVWKLPTGKTLTMAASQAVVLGALLVDAADEAYTQRDGCPRYPDD